jgi:glutathione S-transferase
LANARAKVPLLVVGEAVLCESLVVAEYVAETFGSEVLLPSTAEDRAVMRLFTELCGPSFSYFPLLRATKGDQSPLDTFKEGLVNVDNFLSSLGRKDSGPFLFGEQFTLAECNAAPFLQRCCTVLPAFTGGDDEKPVSPLEICDELGLVRLKRWIEAVLARPSVVATGVPKEDMLKSTTRMLERIAAMESNK